MRDFVTPNLREFAAAFVIALFLFAALQRRYFTPLWPNRRTLICAIVLAILLLAALPIWNRHADFGGVMHGHAIWVEQHVH